MKSQGFDLEQSQIETPQVMAKLILAVLIAELHCARWQLVYARAPGLRARSSATPWTRPPNRWSKPPHRQARGEDRQVEKIRTPEEPWARLSWVVGRLRVAGTDTTAMATSPPAR